MDIKSLEERLNRIIQSREQVRNMLQQILGQEALLKQLIEEEQKKAGEARKKAEAEKKAKDEKEKK